MLLNAAFRNLLFSSGLLFLQSQSAYAEGNEFLKYQEPKSQISLLSSVDTILYTITVFVLILALAYATSRFVGGKFSQHPARLNGDIVLSSLPLGPNKGVYLVKFAGRMLVLGVADQKIDLLADLTDTPNATELAATYQSGKVATAPQFSAVFDSQMASLRQMSNKFPRVFGQYEESNHNAEREREKR